MSVVYVKSLMKEWYVVTLFLLEMLSIYTTGDNWSIKSKIDMHVFSGNTNRGLELKGGLYENINIDLCVWVHNEIE